MTRSELMSRIRSKGNASTELALAGVLRRRKITGWRRQRKVLGISIDFVFDRLKIAVFVDGCFWHGCLTHSRFNKLNDFWLKKIMGNMTRDNEQTKKLQDHGWQVVRIWEHSLKGEKI